MTAEAKERAAEAAIEREKEGFEEPSEVRVHEDETRENRTHSFSRMRFEWAGQDAHVIQTIHQVADDRVMMAFPDAYRIINDIYEVVREQAHDEETGELLTDRHGWPLWQKAPSGRYIEDYSRLGIKQRDEFLMQITTRLFDWEQRAADAWADAMFAKAIWEERFALTFTDPDTPGRKTDESLTQKARLGAREERYFALFEASVSRKIDALVRSLERLAQRLKDSTYT